MKKLINFIVKRSMSVKKHLVSLPVDSWPIIHLKKCKTVGFVLCNLKPRNLVGFRSHGMVMCAARHFEKEKVVCVTPPEGAQIGERITFEGLIGEPFSPAQVEKKKVLMVLGEDMKTDDKGIAKWKEYELQTSKGPCTASVTNGVIR